MSLTRKQKIFLAFFICTLLPSYLIANWRLEANNEVIADRFAREQKLHLSTDKLVDNCERNEKKENDHYSANHQICQQGLKEHESTSHVIELLNQEKSNNEAHWYRNFFLFVVIFNLLGAGIYQIYVFGKREEA